MVEHSRMTAVQWLILLVVTAGILLYDLHGKSLWVDELFTVQVATKQNLADLVQTCIETERRPPLHYLLLHYWMTIAGDSDMAVRLPSVFLALLAILLVGRLARAMVIGQVGILAAAVLSFMPTFVMYSRMSRAYSMNVALGLTSTIVLIEVLKQPSRCLWMSYIISAIALLYTDYALIGLLLAHNVYVGYLALSHLLRRPSPSPALLADGKGNIGCTSLSLALPEIKAWLITQTIIALSFVPWLAVVVAQMQRGKLEADFARGLSGYLLKLAYPVLSLSTGETIFPWHPAAIVGLLGVTCLFSVGVIAFLRRSKTLAVFALVFLVVPFLFTAFLLSSVATDITFINMASRTLFAVPFFALILATGIASLRKRLWQLVAMAILAVAWGTALFNYYTNRDFHNPIYAVPMRQIVEMIATEAQPGDIIVSDIDSGFGYYYTRLGAETPHFSAFTESEAAKHIIEATRAPRVWLVTLGRDRTRVDAPGELFAAWLDAQYRLAESRGYGREDEHYRQLKEMLLGRPDYEYKALVRLYIRP